LKVLITGNLGYVGTELSKYLNSSEYEVYGLDCGFYKDCLLDSSHEDIPTKIKDIRDLEISDLSGFDAVVHLAALSNDPIGELDSNLTYEINRDAAVNSAELAQQAGVSRFIFISTQSIYGVSSSNSELLESSLKSPQTAYAQSKWEAEQIILDKSTPLFTTMALRPSTVFGWSPRLRSDIVFNNLLLSGLSKGKIEVHSDGSPWRPIIHVEDLCVAIRLSLEANPKIVSGKSFNIGKLDGNYQVKDIANAAKQCIGDVEIKFNTELIVDPRSYKVSFISARDNLGFEAERNLVESGMEILSKIKSNSLSIETLMGRMTNRLQQVSFLQREGVLDDSLRFKFRVG